MAYFTVLPNEPLPSVLGLGAVNRFPFQIPRGKWNGRPRGFAGLGDSCNQATLADYMASWLGSLHAEPGVDAILGCGANLTDPCQTPEDAANMVASQVQVFCSEDQAGVDFGCQTDPACNNPGAATQQFYNQALAFFQSLPASTWVGLPATYIPGQYNPTQPTGTPSYTPAAPSAPSAPSFVQTTANLSNVSRPGQPFQAGDQYQLVITGAPNTPVTGTASQNGGPGSSSQFGTTNAQGNLAPILGTFSAGDVGTWNEQWTVGGSSALLQFSVTAVPQQSTNGSKTSDGSGGGSTGSSSTGASTTTPAAPASSLDLSWLTGDVNIFGTQIPVWGLGAAAAALLFLIPRGR